MSARSSGWRRSNSASQHSPHCLVKSISPTTCSRVRSRRERRTTHSRPYSCSQWAWVRSPRASFSAAEALVLLPEFAPALLADFDTVLVGGALDPPPRRVALIVAHILDLVEAGDRVA